jgi:hypothetical protein
MGTHFSAAGGARAPPPSRSASGVLSKTELEGHGRTVTRRSIPAGTRIGDLRHKNRQHRIAAASVLQAIRCVVVGIEEVIENRAQTRILDFQKWMGDPKTTNEFKAKYLEAIAWTAYAVDASRRLSAAAAIESAAHDESRVMAEALLREAEAAIETFEKDLREREKHPENDPLRRTDTSYANIRRMTVDVSRTRAEIEDTVREVRLKAVPALQKELDEKGLRGKGYGRDVLVASVKTILTGLSGVGFPIGIGDSVKQLADRDDKEAATTSEHDRQLKDYCDRLAFWAAAADGTSLWLLRATLAYPE